jgi:hypothetical protein
MVELSHIPAAISMHPLRRTTEWVFAHFLPRLSTIGPQLIYSTAAHPAVQRLSICSFPAAGTARAKALACENRN